MKKKPSNINLANFLSISRIISVFPLIYCLNKMINIDEYKYYTAFIILYIFLSDILDGYFARKSNLVTDLGKIIDPVADKICIMVVLIYLIDIYHLPFVMFLVLLSLRDIILLTYTIYLILFYKYVSEANLSGKMFMFITTIMMISFIYNLNLIFQIIIYLLSLILLFISTYFYIINHKARLKKYESN